MKKLFTFSVLFTLFINASYGQADRRILPKSWVLNSLGSNSIPEIVLPAFSKEESEQLDYSEAKDGKMPKMARNIETNINLNNSGTWTALADGGRIWRVQVSSHGALALAPIFDQFYIPMGAYVHFYMPGKEEIFGAYTHNNTPKTRGFCPGLLHGESCIIEYYEPASQKGKGILDLTKVGHAYRWIDPLVGDEKSGSQSCEVNVVCSEGDNWPNQIRSVCRIFIVGDAGDGFCSGALVNNVRQDCTPYILSAGHCTEGGVTALEFEQWAFLFNYQATTCAGTIGAQTDAVNGCTQLAFANDNDGDLGSDFLLLQLSTIPDSSYNVYYEGWDASGTAPTSGVGIHHPEGDIKKISTVTMTANDSTWGDTVRHTHWQLNFAATTHGHGISEPGSSGSPYFNENGLAVGHLTGGNSCCTVGGCGGSPGPDGDDFYGKISFDWMLNGTTADRQLKPWLDPDNTGALSVQGMNPPCGGSTTDDLGIQLVIEPNGTICSSTFTPTISLRNHGGNTITSATIEYLFDQGNAISQPWAGSLIPGGSVNFDLPNQTLSAGSHTFTVQANNPNGVTNTDVTDFVASSNFYISSSIGALNLYLSTDQLGSQTTWQITDAGSNVVASGGPYADDFLGQQINTSICLAPGCYTFTIFDSQGNGMDAGLEGDFILSRPSDNTFLAALNQPNFGSSEAHPFCVGATGIEEINNFYISIVPNPSNGIFKLGFDNSNEKNLQVIDELGQVVFSSKISGSNYNLDLSGFSKGVYILQLENNSAKTVRKLVLK